MTGFYPHIPECPDDTEALRIVDSLTIVGHVVDGLVIFELEKCHWRKFGVTAAGVVAAGRHFGCRVEAMPGDREVKLQDSIVTSVITALRTYDAQLSIGPEIQYMTNVPAAI